MRPVAFILSATLLLMAAVIQSSPRAFTQANLSSTAITDCAREGAAVQGACSPVSLDSTPAQILSYQVYAGGCAGADLHVVRYMSQGREETSAPLSARWCA